MSLGQNPGFAGWQHSDPAAAGFQDGDFYYNIAFGQWRKLRNGLWLPAHAADRLIVTPSGGPGGDGGDFGAHNDTTNTLGIQDALNQRRAVYVAAGSYDLPEGFHGIALASNADIEFDMKALVNVPNGYAGDLLSVVPSASFAKARGGTFNEQGTPRKLWDFISLSSTNSSGVEFCWFEHMFAYFCNRGVVLKVGGAGTYVNANRLLSLTIDQPNVGVDWVQDGGQMEGNFLQDIQIEAGHLSSFLNGFRNVWGKNTLLAHCYVYDDDSGSGSNCTIASGAQRTKIVGGNLTETGFVDNGAYSDILDGSQVVHNVDGAMWWPQAARAGATTPGKGSTSYIFNSNLKDLFLNAGNDLYLRSAGASKLAVTPSGTNIFTRIYAINGATTSLTDGSVIQVLVKSGIPADTDFTTPVDGIVVLDTTNRRLYVRSGGVWHYATLTLGV